MASIASSSSLPMVGCLALAWRWDQRASLGTQKMVSAVYSSRSSGSAYGAVWSCSYAVLEGVGDVLEEDQTARDVLVLGGVHVSAHLVSGGPERLLEAEVGAGSVPALLIARHRTTTRSSRLGVRAVHSR